MEELFKTKVDKSLFDGSTTRYQHDVVLYATDDSDYLVVVTRHNNFGIGKKDIKTVRKSSLSEAEEIYNFFVRKLEQTQK